jgi:hypothetical protein
VLASLSVGEVRRPPASGKGLSPLIGAMLIGVPIIAFTAQAVIVSSLDYAYK